MKTFRHLASYIPGCIGMLLAIISATIGFASLMLLELADYVEGRR